MKHALISQLAYFFLNLKTPEELLEGIVDRILMLASSVTLLRGWVTWPAICGLRRFLVIWLPIILLLQQQ